MELEFDKEIDALLRKARRGTSAAVMGTHLDADAVAAFAEGAIPDAIRKTYTAHLADCDSCRKALSYVAVLNEPAAMKAVAATAGAPAMRAPAPAMTSVPWYRPLFRSPGLAAAFGLLVLALGGGLIYLITQRNSNTASTVALEENKPASSSVPYAGIDTNAAASNANAMSNSTSTANVAVSNSPRSLPNSTSSTAAKPGATTVDGTDSLAAAPPPSSSSSGAVSQPTTTTRQAEDLPINGRQLNELPLDKSKTASEDRKQDKDENKKETTRSRALEDDRLARGDTAAKKVPAGPMRGAGPVQNQIQSNIAAGQMPVTRRVAGKTFHNSNGAWYDTAYHGQSTNNVRRGGDEFKKLDSGLRAIANELGGVVVVVWKDKAYRIQ